MLTCEEGNSKLLEFENEAEFCSYFPLLEILISGTFFSLIILAALYLRIFYKETIIIWIFSKSWGKLLFPEDILDQNKPYDVFLSYSHHDAEYVENKLLPGLESKDNLETEQYKCLIHTRDWEVGETISDQIVESVERSKRTLVVLTTSYLSALWTKLEFKAAHTKAMEDKTQRVIVIVHGEIPSKENLDTDLQKYFTANTCLNTEDPWFWHKLRYSLPKKRRKKVKKDDSRPVKRQFSMDGLLTSDTSKQTNKDIVC